MLIKVLIRFFKNVSLHSKLYCKDNGSWLKEKTSPKLKPFYTCCLVDVTEK